jgi:hypothetical protein
MDTIEKPVVDEEVFIEFSNEQEEECQHQDHPTGMFGHAGPAVYWLESQCVVCGWWARGYRCKPWAVLLMSTIARGMSLGGQCLNCHKFGHTNPVFTPIGNP